jgi:DNA-binding XRE family transcriptional regulator
MQIKPIHFTNEITVFQFRAARYSLRITRNNIIHDTGISSSTLSELENEPLFSSPKSQKTAFSLRSFYESKGIIFLEGNTIKYDQSGDGIPNYIFYIENDLDQSTS